MQRFIKMQELIIIDKNWVLKYTQNQYTLIEIMESNHPKSKSEITQQNRGYYAHIDEALKAYLRKSIQPCDSIHEIVALIESGLVKIEDAVKELRG